MSSKIQPPWSTGPSEILIHASSLLVEDSDSNRRLAMIAIDNSVELIIKTYLGLPKRINGLNIPRKEYDAFSGSFPKLLDAIEEYAEEKLDGIDIGEIEWYHRLRNQLYHQGNGLTVERTKVDIYLQLASILFEKLFDYKVDINGPAKSQKLGVFLREWQSLEAALQLIAKNFGNSGRATALDLINSLVQHKVISESEAKELHGMRVLRNMVVHGDEESIENLSDREINRVKMFFEMMLIKNRDMDSARP